MEQASYDAFVYEMIKVQELNTSSTDQTIAWTLNDINEIGASKYTNLNNPNEIKSGVKARFSDRIYELELEKIYNGSSGDINEIIDELRKPDTYKHPDTKEEYISAEQKKNLDKIAQDQLITVVVKNTVEDSQSYKIPENIKNNLEVLNKGGTRLGYDDVDKLEKEYYEKLKVELNNAAYEYYNTKYKNSTSTSEIEKDIKSIKDNSSISVFAPIDKVTKEKILASAEKNLARLKALK